MRRFGKAGLLGLFVGLSVALVADRHATGQASSDDGAGSGSSEGFNPFTLTDPGPGATPFEALSPAEQDDVNAQAETSETNCGANVQMAFAHATEEEAERARAEIAARSVGMEGAEQDGVVP